MRMATSSGKTAHQLSLELEGYGPGGAPFLHGCQATCKLQLELKSLSRYLSCQARYVHLRKSVEELGCRVEDVVVGTFDATEIMAVQEFVPDLLWTAVPPQLEKLLAVWGMVGGGGGPAAGHGPGLAGLLALPAPAGAALGPAAPVPAPAGGRVPPMPMPAPGPVPGGPGPAPAGHAAADVSQGA